MITLGLQTSHESSAVLFEDDQLVAAISDERLTRIKNEGGSLRNDAIDEVLRIAGKSRQDVDRLALLYTFFPEEYVRRESWYKQLERSLSRKRKPRNEHERPQISLNNFIQRLEARGLAFEDHFYKQQFLQQEGFVNAQLSFYDHHAAHALAAVYYSGFSECAVITLDGEGDRGMHHTSGIFQQGEYQRDYVSDDFGASAGMFYSHTTQMLGYKPMRHEGKIVGLAAMGDAAPLMTAFAKALYLAPDGQHLASDFADEQSRAAYMRQVSEGCSREDISATTQQLLEDVVVQLVKNYLNKTGMRKLALNGGIFANVKLNQRIAMLDGLDDLFVFPGMSDTGNSVGAVALDFAAHTPKYLKTPAKLGTVYWGPEFSDVDIEAALCEFGLPIERLEDEVLIQRTAQCIHDGKVIGWFQGRMEFGPRALGNRSMLAKPTDKAINDWLNERLERSEFMPFAPSVLAEHADEIFIGVDKARHAAEFMTVTFDVQFAWRERIEAVVHVDGTARPQLVRADRNPRYHQLISAYYALSGIPLLLNTSFNAHEEPIVCKPQEAIQAFVDQRIDCLAVGNYWLAH